MLKRSNSADSANSKNEKVFKPMARYSKYYRIDFYPYLIVLYLLLLVLFLFKNIYLFIIFSILAYPVLRAIFKWKKNLNKNLEQWNVEGFSSITFMSDKELLLLGGFAIPYKDIEKVYITEAEKLELSGWYKYYSRMYFFNKKVIFVLRDGNQKVLPIQDRITSHFLLKAIVDAGFCIYSDFSEYKLMNN